MASNITSRASRGSGASRVFIHQSREQRLIERTPIDADAHRLVILDGDFDHAPEVVIVMSARADVTRIDPVLGERLRASP